MTRRAVTAKRFSQRTFIIAGVALASVWLPQLLAQSSPSNAARRRIFQIPVEAADFLRVF